MGMAKAMAKDEAYQKAEKKIKAARRSGAKELDLSGAWDDESLKLTELPESLGRLTALQSLNLSWNQLTALPESLGQLTALRSLILSDNQLTALPESLGRLTALQSLKLDRNQLTALPESLGQLTALQSLDLYSNELTALPESLGRLAALQSLNLSDNLLTALPESLGRLIQLESLYLHYNDNLGLPVEVLGPDFIEIQLAMYQKQPARPADILDYYFRTRRGRRRLNEAKLILVGRGGVGKTCLIKRLIHDTFDEHEQETPGIEIQPWQVSLADGDSVRLHVWDFGGQEILHATHQFFLTERTVYLLVLSGREGSATQDAEYWLQLIKSFGGHSPIIIALNKSIQHPFDVNRGLLLEKYPQIAKFVHTDCQNTPVGALGVTELHQSILDAIENVGLRKTDFPADWFDIKERLAAMKENFLPWDSYQEICRSLGEKDAKAQRDLAGFLHILGIALNYRDDLRLRETSVLNPRWVTEGIYSLLRIGQKERQEREGVLEIADLAGALDAQDYPASSHEFLLALMEKFQLCFQLPSRRKRYLVPELLGENQPEEIRLLVAEPGLGFRYQYEVLPEGLLPRFIVQTHGHSEANPKWRWRTGVVLNRDGCRAVVRADARERRVDIHISGPARQRRDLLAIIRDRFDEQHSDLKGLVVDQRVPVPGEPGVTVSYNFLLTLESKGKSTVWPEGAQQEYPVADLLNGVDTPERRAERHTQERTRSLEVTMSKKHVFLSYCHDNSDEAEQLHNNLIAAGEAVWWDQDILPGQDWKLEIDKAMKHAYAVLLCLSAETESRTTSGIYPEAANAIGALREYAPGNVFLIPVRFSDCEIPMCEIDATRRLDRLQFVDLFPPAKRTANLKKLIDALQSAPHHP